MEDTCYINGKLLLKRMSDGEAQESIKKSKLNITTFKNVGPLFPNTIITDSLVQVKPSKDFISNPNSQNLVVNILLDNLKKIFNGYLFSYVQLIVTLSGGL